MALTAEIKFRCEGDLVARFERIATLERRDRSDLARIVFEDYVAAQERALKLVLRETPPPYKPTTDSPTLPPVPPHQTDTTYLKRKRRKKT